MENKNSKITEEYKAEITDILSKISLGLGESVIEAIEPKIIDFNSNLKENYKSIQLLNIEQKKIIKETENYFNKLDSKLISEVKINRKFIENSTNRLSHLYKNQLNEIKEKQEKIKRLLYLLIFLIVVVFTLFSYSYFS
jgi:hypothetical protein